ncbi:MAG: tetratricopeptide repeat protein [bacterium]
MKPWMSPFRRECEKAVILAGLSLSIVLSGCATPRSTPLDPEIKLLAGTAATAYQRGEMDRADELYRKARQRARLIDDPGEVARNTYNLALCRTAQGRLNEARSLLKQAGALTGNKGVDASRILLAEAEVARLSGESAESGRLACEALAAGSDREGRVQALLLQGEAEAAVNRLPEARTHFKAAQSGATDRTPALVRARLEALAVRLIQAKLVSGDEAARQLSRAQWLKKAGQFRMMVQALDGAAQRYEQDSKWNEAFQCRLRATQSLLAAGDKVSALAMLRKADELAERSGEDGNKALVMGLAGEMQ